MSLFYSGKLLQSWHAVSSTKSKLESGSHKHPRCNSLEMKKEKGGWGGTHLGRFDCRAKVKVQRKLRGRMKEKSGNRGSRRESGNCQTIRYGFERGGATSTAPCSRDGPSHVEWLLMEPSYPVWTSVMKFYSSYWIWQWDLCLSCSCCLAFIAKPPRPPDAEHARTHTPQHATQSYAVPFAPLPLLLLLLSSSFTPNEWDGQRCVFTPSTIWLSKGRKSKSQKTNTSSSRKRPQVHNGRVVASYRQNATISEG